MIVKGDVTYCVNKECKNRCWRHLENYEVENGAFYSVTEECIKSGTNNV